MDGYLRLQRLTRSFDEVTALDSLTLDVARGEFLTVLGPSGSGKTTTLNLIAGFDFPTSGDIYVAERRVTWEPAYRRGVGMVFQNYALFPHMTVAENVGFPLRMRRVGPAEARRRVEQALDLVRLGGLEGRVPRQLSGGQQQRVALARALVYEPAVLLMDEPLGALDRKLRAEMQFEIKRLHRELGTTVLYVTHDQEEALSMSDRIAVLHRGTLEQCAPPRELYERPASTFVAGFVGDANFLAATVVPSGGALSARLLDLDLSVPIVDGGMFREGERVVVCVRPEHVRLARDVSNERRHLVRVGETIFLGDAVKCQLRTERTNLIAKVPLGRDEGIPEPGRSVSVTLDAGRCSVFHEAA